MDVLITGIPTAVIFGLLGGFDDLGDDPNQFRAFGSGEDFLFTLLGLAVTMAYFTLLEGSSSGQTIGKKALSIRVIGQVTGQPIGSGRALGRNAVRTLPGYLPVIGLFWGLLDGLWMLWDKEKQTLHDKASKTVVVPVAAFPIQREYDPRQQQSYGQPPPGGYNPNS